MKRFVTKKGRKIDLFAKKLRQKGGKSDLPTKLLVMLLSHFRIPLTLQNQMISIEASRGGTNFPEGCYKNRKLFVGTYKRFIKSRFVSQNLWTSGNRNTFLSIKFPGHVKGEGHNLTRDFSSGKFQRKLFPEKVDFGRELDHSKFVSQFKLLLELRSRE